MIDRRARRLTAGAVLLIALLVPARAPAQVPWTVTVTPTVNPLQIGGCGPVRLTLALPGTTDWPRNPKGNYVALSDFDMTVTGVDPAGVAGESNGPSIWSACACQGATVGSTATVTATYPAKNLAPPKRVLGVAFQKSASFVIAKARGAYQPPSCQALAGQTVVAAGAPPGTAGAAGSTTTTTTTALPATGTTTTTTTTATTAPTTTTATTTPPLTVITTMAPNTATTPTPTTTTTATVMPTATTSGQTPPVSVITTAAPTSATATLSRAALTGVTITPTVKGVRVTWASDIAGYETDSVALYRQDGPGPAKPVGYFDDNDTDWGCSFDQVTGRLCATAWFADDVLPNPLMLYTYSIKEFYWDGTQAASASVAWQYPAVVNPSRFTAQAVGGTVAFTWAPVPGAMQYRLDGPPLPNTGLTLPDTTATLKGVPIGTQQWQVVAMFPSNIADYAKPSTVSLIVRVPPSHGVPWLSKKNGPGNDSTAALHYQSLCAFLSYNTGLRNSNCAPDLATEMANVPGLLDASGAIAFTAVYGNTADLGFGRRTSCAEGLAPPPGYLTTICMTSSHGPGAGQAGFGDPTTITDAAWQNTSINTTTIITKDATGMRFLVFGPPGGGGGYASGPYGGVAPSHFTLIDTEGQKFAPHTCLACHGGTYDATTKRVQGASFLPLDPWMFVYKGGPSGRAAQEDKIRQINNFVLRSKPSAAIVAYLNGLYGGAVAQTGAKATDDFVPSGWSAQTGLYQKVVRPYCMSCHLAQQPAYSFSSWGNFQGNAALIQAAVCMSHSMPHAEVPFKEMWTKSGTFFLPGLLAASLGYPSC